MKKSEYLKIEKYMLSCMNDSAHDKEHIYRVLYFAMDIAHYEVDVNIDILMTACLLHDIGREQQFKNPKLCHAKVGGEMSYTYLIENGWSIDDAQHIKDCINTHRYRNDNIPQSIEAKILFDSDKLDVTGAVGIARTLLYAGQVSVPLYSLDDDRNVLDGTGNEKVSFFQEYNYKLKNLYNRFFTQRAKDIAKERQISAISFYENMLREVNSNYETGMKELKNILL